MQKRKLRPKWREFKRFQDLIDYEYGFYALEELKEGRQMRRTAAKLEKKRNPGDYIK